MFNSWQYDWNADRNCGPPSVRIIIGYPKSRNHELMHVIVDLVSAVGNLFTQMNPEYLSTMRRWDFPRQSKKSRKTSCIGADAGKFLSSAELAWEVV